MMDYPLAKQEKTYLKALRRFQQHPMTPEAAQILANQSSLMWPFRLTVLLGTIHFLCVIINPAAFSFSYVITTTVITSAVIVITLIKLIIVKRRLLHTTQIVWERTPNEALDILVKHQQYQHLRHSRLQKSYKIYKYAIPSMAIFAGLSILCLVLQFMPVFSAFNMGGQAVFALFASFILFNIACVLAMSTRGKLRDQDIVQKSLRSSMPELFTTEALQGAVSLDERVQQGQISISERHES